LSISHIPVATFAQVVNNHICVSENHYMRDMNSDPSIYNHCLNQYTSDHFQPSPIRLTKEVSVILSLTD